MVSDLYLMEFIMEDSAIIMEDSSLSFASLDLTEDDPCITANESHNLLSDEDFFNLDFCFYRFIEPR